MNFFRPVSIFILLFSPLLLNAQDAEVDQLKALYKAELEKPYVKAVKWELDFDKAMKRAQAENKLIFVYFTRSFKENKISEKVEKNLLTTEAFKKFAKDKVLYLGITTQIPDRKYDYLYRKLNYNGFPILTILSYKGEKLAEPDDAAVNCTVEILVETYKKALKKAGVLDKEFVKLMQELKKELEDTKKKAKDFDEQAQFELEIYEVVKKMKKMSLDNLPAFEKTAENFYGKYKKGKRCKLFHNRFRFYELVVRHAIKIKDGATAVKALKDLDQASELAEKRLPREATRYNQYVRELKRRVKALNAPEKEDDTE